jgi:ABC-2 type transport system ATP-binding protein
LAVRLAEPSSGEATVLGGLQVGSPAALDGIAFLAQDMPLYKTLSAADPAPYDPQPELAVGPTARDAPTRRVGHPLKRKAAKMSSGQQAQLALTLALARRPQLLVLDEPMAMLCWPNSNA